MFTFTADQLKNSHSGQYLRELSKAGYEPKPVVDWAGTEYVMLSVPTPKPGRQTVDVLNVTEFNSTGSFRIAVDGRGCAFVAYEDEGWSILTVRKGELHDFPNPVTAVLTYQIVAPTREQIAQTADEMDDQLQDGGALHGLASEMGRRGGAVTGGNKATASRENGKKGGRKISKITEKAIELWKELPADRLGRFPYSYSIRETLTAEFPDETNARISNCAMQAVRMLKREAKK